MIKNFNEYLGEDRKQFNVPVKVTVPYEGDAYTASKRYNLEIINTNQDRIGKARGSAVVTFKGTHTNILKLLSEFGGEANVIDTMDAPYGRITTA